MQLRYSTYAADAWLTCGLRSARTDACEQVRKADLHKLHSVQNFLF